MAVHTCPSYPCPICHPIDALRDMDARQLGTVFRDATVEAGLIAENARLRRGIQAYIDGDYGFNYHGSKLVKCPHGQYRYETCEGCIDQHFIELLAVDGQSMKDTRETK